MNDLAIKIDEHGNTLSDPILLENLKLVHPKATINNLPYGYAKFQSSAKPAVGIYEKIDGYVYIKIDDYYTQQYNIVSMTDEEKLQKQTEVKASWAETGFPSWTFNEELCCFEPPVINPAQKLYEWNEDSQSWIEIT
jgi:hypothetical protein